jgi:hypothetical protein
MPEPLRVAGLSLVRSPSALFALVVAIGSFALSYYSHITAYSTLDARGATLTAQALIQHGSLRLDNYDTSDLSWQKHITNQHVYYAYPIGSAIFSIPFVWVSLDSGNDMQNHGQEYRTQKRTAAVTVALASVLIFFLIRCFCTFPVSVLLTTVWTFGSGIISTMGSALWSINLAVVLALAICLILARYQTGLSGDIHPCLLGLLLFAAYLSRPTAAILCIAVALFVFSRNRIASFKLVGVFACCFVVFVLFSEQEFHQLFPFYYSPAYLESHKVTSFRAWVVDVYGLLFSPARGLFVYQPFLLLVSVVLLVRWQHFRKKGLTIMVAVWLALHFLVTSRLGIWWGGGSYGSRLLVETFPGWIVLSAVAASVVMQSFKWLFRFLVSLAFFILSAFSVYVHSYEGLYNVYTWYWNEAPGSNKIMPDKSYPVNMLDWRYPQFLANPETCEELSRQSDVGSN